MCSAFNIVYTAHLSHPCLPQVVVPSQLLPPDLSHHSCVSVTGHLCESSHPKQPVELRATQVILVGQGHIDRLINPGDGVGEL